MHFTTDFYEMREMSQVSTVKNFEFVNSELAVAKRFCHANRFSGEVTDQ